jgi:hypothetical protein
MADRLDVLLGILLDKSAQRDFERGVSSMEDHIRGLDEEGLDNLLQGFEDALTASELLEKQFAAAKEETAALNQVGTQLGQVSAVVAAAGAAIVGGIAVSAQQYVSFVEKAGIQGDETADRWIAASKRVQNAQLNLGEASAQVLLPVYEKAAELAEKAAAFVQENPDLVQAALNTGLVVATLGAVGIAVSKGIKLYADFKYLAATAEYSLATTRFQNAVREMLAGQLLGGAGGAAQYALNSAGRPYDTTTGRFVSRAAYEESLRTGAAGAGGALSGAATKIGQVTLLASAVIIGVNAGAAIGNALARLVYGEDYQKQDLKDAFLTATRLPTAPLLALYNELEKLDGPLGDAAAKMGELVRKGDRFTQKILGMGEAAEAAGDAAGEASQDYRDFQQEATQAQATQAFIQYRQQEQQAEEQYMAQRAQIVEQGARQIAQIEANYTKQRTRLIEQFATSSAQAVANFEFSQRQAEEQFAFSEAQAVRDFNEQRAEAREEFQRDEQRSREDHLREMRKLAEDHQDRLRDLAIARDALGIIEENRDYARRRQDAESEYRTDSQRRRQDFQRQQQEREQEFQQERARRRQEFEFRQQQALEQFERQQKLAREQFEERLEQLDEEHEAEIALARRNTAEKLRQLQEQYREEQITRRNAFYDILRDLDANLLNEKNLRAQYYERMQQDLMNFLESTAGAAGSNLPGYPTETHQAGGYGPGYVGAGEFVTSRSTTRMLEGLVGGRLTQRSFAQVVARGGGGVTLNDQRRFYGSISNEERRMIQEDTQDLLENIHGII